MSLCRLPADTTKRAGADCPKCGAKCAEFKHLHETFTRWSCTCGAAGRLASDQAAAAPAAQEPPRKVHPHWSDRARKKA